MDYGFEKPATAKRSLNVPQSVVSPALAIPDADPAELVKATKAAGFDRPAPVTTAPPPADKPKRKRGRPPKSAGAGQGTKKTSRPGKTPTIKQMPFIEGLPADWRFEDDDNSCMTIHGPDRVREMFESIKAEFGTMPSWAVLHMLCHRYRQNPVE